MYREAVKKHSSVFYIPSLMIMMKDLTAIAELGLYKKHEGADILNEQVIHLLKDFGNNYAKTFGIVRNHKYVVKEGLPECFKTLLDS